MAAAVALGLVIVAMGLALGWLISPTYCPVYGGLAQPVTACFHPDLVSGEYLWPANDSFVSQQADGSRTHGPNDPVIPVGSKIDGAPSSPPGILFDGAGIAIVGLAWVAWRRLPARRQTG